MDKGRKNLIDFSIYNNIYLNKKGVDRYDDCKNI